MSICTWFFERFEEGVARRISQARFERFFVGEESMTPYEDGYLYLTEAQIIVHEKTPELARLRFVKYLVDEEGLADVRGREDLEYCLQGLGHPMGVSAGGDNRMLMRRMHVAHEWEPGPADVAAVLVHVDKLLSGGKSGELNVLRAQESDCVADF